MVLYNLLYPLRYRQPELLMMNKHNSNRANRAKLRLQFPQDEGTYIKQLVSRTIVRIVICSRVDPHKSYNVEKKSIFKNVQRDKSLDVDGISEHYQQTQSTICYDVIFQFSTSKFRTLALFDLPLALRTMLYPRTF